MKAYHLILFFVCINASLYLIQETQVLSISTEPIESLDNIYTRMLSGFVTFTVVAIITGLGGYLAYGVTIGLLLWVADIFLGSSGIISWIIYGIPQFATQAALMAGADASVMIPIGMVLRALMAVVWFWFMIGLLTQRGTFET